MTLPTFLVVGTAKAGTTSLWHYLNTHPDIFMSPVKEPQYFTFSDETCFFDGPRDMERFNRVVVRDWDKYQRLFLPGKAAIARAEASTWYLYFPGAAERIHRYLPHVKIVVILRNPADRAFSAYLHCVRDAVETVSFERAIEMDRLGLRDNWLPFWHYWKMGLYYRQVRTYYEVFGPERVQIHLHDDLQSNPRNVVRSIARFVGVRDDVPISTDHHHNVAGIPRMRWLHDMLTWSTPITRLSKFVVPPRILHPTIERIKSLNLGPAPRISDESRRRLLNMYHDDIQNLERLIGRDLSHWLAERSPAGRAAA